MDIPQDRCKEIREKYKEDPIGFFIDILGMDRDLIWSKMEEMTLLVASCRKLAVKAGHSVSKTYTAGRIVLWYLYTHYPSTVITTAPTDTQVRELLWRELKSAYNKALIPLGGKLIQTQLDLQGAGDAEKWFALGFSTRPDQGMEHAQKMQGFHNENMMLLFDEADGVLPAIWDSADSLLTSARVKFLAIGNPLSAQSKFARCFSDPSFEKLTISVKDTPNFKEGKEVIPGLSGREYEEDMRRKWGIDSAMYQSRVLGNIPDSNPDSIISLAQYERAEARNVNEEKAHGIVKRFITVDVADGGDDCTVVKGWRNKEQISEDRFPGKKAEEMYGDVWRICKQIDGNAIIYDHDGCGRILGGLLRGVVSEGTKIIGFEGSSTECDEDFYNKRAEGYYLLYKDFAGNNISIFKGNELLREEATSIRWGDPKKNKMIVEPKVNLKKRISRSPDDLDCVMMMSACYDEVEPVKAQDRYADHARRLRGMALEDDNNLFGGNE